MKTSSWLVEKMTFWANQWLSTNNDNEKIGLNF